MNLLRKQARQVATSFKDIADEVWGELGDMQGVAQEYKDISRSAGKYALTAQLLMTLNFPDDAEVFSNSFNITNSGPTGKDGFADTPIGHLLDIVAGISMQRNAQAIGTQGFADVTATSTITDLSKLLPKLRNIRVQMAKKGGKK